MPRGHDRKMYRHTGATCLMCGRYAGNIEGVPVYRYRLQRSNYEGGSRKSINVGSIGMCDPCIDRYSLPIRVYNYRHAPVRHRHIKIDGGETEWHMHPDYVPLHRHPELGPGKTDA